MAERVRVAVVGAGLIGAAVGYELADAGIETLVVDAAAEPAAGISRSNSGIVHTGFDSTPGTLETAMIRSQAARWRALFDALGVPYQVPGALLVGAEAADAESLAKLAANAARNGVSCQILDARDCLRLAPQVRAAAGLLIPEEALTDPYEVTRRLLGAGPPARFGCSVDEVAERGEHAMLRGGDLRLEADFVVNCAGLYADDIAADGSFSITARRGDFIVYDSGACDLVRHILLPPPSRHSKGVLVFPTLYGFVCAGPTAVDQTDKADWRPDPRVVAYIRERAEALVPKLASHRVVDSWTGLRAVGHPHNYIVQWSHRVPAMLHVAAIRSTGLSACLGLADYVRSLLGVRGVRSARRLRNLGRPPDYDAPRPWWRRLADIRAGA
ncbi:MAG: FAD-dependent oxidoreductase [Candidatus Eremiobacteraeota bacterium]|nr:FAD-dependent oxidoreductase [Candidatus Eremiobacteraeota bacterium]